MVALPLTTATAIQIDAVLLLDPSNETLSKLREDIVQVMVGLFASLDRAKRRLNSSSPHLYSALLLLHYPHQLCLSSCETGKNSEPDYMFAGD